MGCGKQALSKPLQRSRYALCSSTRCIYCCIGPRVNRIINNVRLADDIKFVPLKNVVSKDAQATICLR